MAILLNLLLSGVIVYKPESQYNMMDSHPLALNATCTNSGRGADLSSDIWKLPHNCFSADPERKEIFSLLARRHQAY